MIILNCSRIVTNYREQINIQAPDFMLLNKCTDYDGIETGR